MKEKPEEIETKLDRMPSLRPESADVELKWEPPARDAQPAELAPFQSDEKIEIGYSTKKIDYSRSTLVTTSWNYIYVLTAVCLGIYIFLMLIGYGHIK